MAVLLKANGQIEVIDRGSEFPLDELQKLVGGYIEVVRPRFRGLALFPVRMYWTIFSGSVQASHSLSVIALPSATSSAPA